MPTTSSRFFRPIVFAAAVYTVLGGYVHSRDWIEGYRHIPSVVPGWWVVRVGFPISALTALALAGFLVFAALRVPRLAAPALLANIGFQAASLGVLIATRVGSVFGWSEHSWTQGATQIRAVEVGAILMSALAIAVLRFVPRKLPVPIHVG